jgi:putative ABC transport system permease protein
MSFLHQFRFALRSLGRDLKAGELRVLALALIIAVASVTAVGFFTDRIGRAMERQAADVLAADLLATSGIALPDGIEQEADRRGLTTARHTRFPSVLITDDDDSQLVAVKAVTAGYPLRGALKLTTLDAPQTAAPLPTPEPGTVWVDAQLKNGLALEQGDTITLGALDFAVTRVIEFEPDRGENVFEIAPRVMMNEADLAASELLSAGSRARFTVLMAGEPEQTSGMQDWLKDNMASEVRVQSVRDGSPQLQRALNRARTFLGLASVVTVLLAGAAIALAVRQFALHQADASAVMRTLGASRNEVIVWLVLRLAFIVSIASIIGIGIGWFAQLVLANLLETWFGLAMPGPGIWAPIIGALTAFIAVAGFGLMPVLRAGRVAVMRVLQRDYSGLDTSVVITVILGLIATYFVVMLQSRDWLLSAIVVAGVVLMLAVFAFFGRFIIHAVRRLAGARYRLAVAGLQRRAGSSVIQLAAFAMGIMALLLIAIVRVDILQAWEQDIPPNAPNVFVINVQPDQVDGFRERLESQNIDVAGLYPNVRARLAAHNGVPTLRDEQNGRQQRRSRREYNLTYANEPPLANEITSGEWWPTDGSAEPGWSIEEDWAKDQGYKIGDTLTFKVAGVETTAPITNFRKVDWESFQVNFFVVASPATLESMPATFVTSFKLDDDFSTTTGGWAREFPGIAALNIGAIMERVKTLMDRASMAVEYVFLFTIAAGICVLLAAVQSSQAERIRESALLRALGASHAQIKQAVIAEFAILGAIAGFLAAFFATLVAWALSRFVFELPFEVNGMLWLIGIVGGAIGISIAGFMATKRVLSTPPVVALRHAG